MPRSSEAALWCAVVAQAFLDATNHMPSVYKRGGVNRNESRAWLIYPSAEFDEVCEMAGVDASVVRQCAIDLALDGWQRPR